MTNSPSPIHVVSIQKCNSLSYVRELLAVHGAGEIAMPVDAEEMAEQPGLHVRRHIRCEEGGGWFDENITPQSGDDIAQISLTSGTTGRPKPIALSHRALADVTERLVEAMGLNADVREYIGVPVTYSFGFGRVRAVAAAGGKAYLPVRGFRPDEFAAMLEKGEVNALSVVPTLLRLILAQPGRFAGIGEKLRWMEIGSQAMSLAEKQSVRDIFPNARIIQHYGLTEASRTTFLDISEADDVQLASVGKACGSVEVKITEDSLIAIRGPHVAQGIVTADGVEPLTNADGWLVTKDLGRLENGYLHYGGRADDLVNVGGVKVPAELFEEKLLARLPQPVELACAAGEDALRGQIIVVAHRDNLPESDLLPIEAAATAVAEEMGAGDGFAFFPVPHIPRTETNKVRRREISALYAEAMAQRKAEVASKTPSGTLVPDEAVRQAFREVVGARADDGTQSLRSLGCDSLQYVTLLLAIEPHIPALPEEWDMLSIDELAALARSQAVSPPAENRIRRLIPDNLNSVRGLACIMIVALHVVGLTPSEGLRLPEGSLWVAVMDFFSPVRLPLFTAMAGFLYAAMPATREGFAPFMQRRLGQLLPPLLFATLVFWGLRKVVFGNDDSLLWAYIDGYLHLWYIEALLLIFVVGALIDTRIGSRPTIWLGAMLCTPFIHAVMPNWPVMHIKNATHLFAFFAFGVLLYRVPALLRSGWLTGVAALLLVPVMALQLVPQDMAMSYWIGRIVYWIAPIIVTLAVLRYFPRIKSLDAIALYSFTIYLWHPAANAAMRTLMWKLHISNVPTMFVIGLVAGVGIPIIMHKIVMHIPYVRTIIIGRT